MPAAVAKVTTVEGVSVGLQERSTELLNHKTIEVPFNATGNPIVSSSSVYAIYWDPRDLYHGDWQHLINGFLRNMGNASGALNSVFAADTQYTDAAGKHAAQAASLKGSYTDTVAYPTAGCADPSPLVEGDAVTCLTDAQVRAELQRFIAAHSLPKGMSTIYYVLTPPGVTTCLDATATSCSDYSRLPESEKESYANSFCSYHSDIEPGPGEQGTPETILYAMVPWTAGGLGDGHLAEGNRTPAYDCQAGGWEPVAESPPEKQEAKPTQQEPNQIGLGPDGYYDTGLADLIVNQIATEQQNVVTDPLLNAWHDEGGGEVTDECRDYFAPSLGGTSAAQSHTEAGTLANQALGEGHYYLNDTFNFADGMLPYPSVTPCVNGVLLVPSFTAPNTVNAGEVAGFDGMESDVTLNGGVALKEGKATPTYAVYEWSFGDGTTVTGFAPGAAIAGSSSSPCEEPWLAPCAASAFHSYAYGGTYDVTLKITDTGGHVSSLTQRINVVGPPPPPPSGPSSSTVTSGGTGTKSGSTSTTSSTSASTSKPPLPRPVATAIVTTGSLTEALHRGLPVRYSVNQQVAGHFEVLLPSSLAKRLHIKGRTASGLAAGTPPQTVIAYALLVTMHKAHGTLRIEIPQPANSRLGHLHEVTLTLRLVVRNASRSKPKLTLLQTVVKLRR